MSVRFVGGPADGHELNLQRAPLHLRVVVDTTKPLRQNGTPARAAIDALDLVSDTPTEHETVHVYRLRSQIGGPMHVCGKGGCRIHVSALYHHREDVDGQDLRDTEAWQAWAQRAGEWIARAEGWPDEQAEPIPDPLPPPPRIGA